MFYSEELLALQPTPKLEDHPLSAVSDFLFNIFAATLHVWRHLHHLQHKDVPCHGDRDPHNIPLLFKPPAFKIKMSAPVNGNLHLYDKG
jgi:hypothetical protein